jgi:hypothetical protein
MAIYFGNSASASLNVGEINSGKIFKGLQAIVGTEDEIATKYLWRQCNDTGVSTFWYTGQYMFGKYFLFPGYGYTTNNYLVSEDGEQWELGTFGLNNASHARSFCSNDRIFVTNGNTKYLEYTTDGVNWNYSTIPSYGWWGALYANGMYIITGSDYIDATHVQAKIAYSEDCINWTQVDLKEVEQDNAPYVSWRATCYGDGKFIVMPCNTKTGFYSYDGKNWEEFYLPDDSDTYYNIYNIAYGNGVFVAMSNARKNYLTSNDGIHWTKQEFDNLYSHYVGFDGKHFIALSGCIIKYSEDGINWKLSKNEIDLSNEYDVLLFGNGKYITAGYNTSTPLVCDEKDFIL